MPLPPEVRKENIAFAFQFQGKTYFLTKVLEKWFDFCYKPSSRNFVSEAFKKAMLVRNILISISVISGLGMVLGFLFQSPRASGLGAISGSASRFKVRAPKDRFLEKLTAICAIIFVLFVIILTVIDPAVWK